MRHAASRASPDRHRRRQNQPARDAGECRPGWIAAWLWPDALSVPATISLRTSRVQVPLRHHPRAGWRQSAGLAAWDRSPGLGQRARRRLTGDGVPPFRACRRTARPGLGHPGAARDHVSGWLRTADVPPCPYSAGDGRRALDRRVPAISSRRTAAASCRGRRTPTGSAWTCGICQAGGG